MLVSGKCPLCGSEIQIPEAEENCFCTVCGERVITKAAIAYYDNAKESSKTNFSEKSTDCDSGISKIDNNARELDTAKQSVVQKSAPEHLHTIPRSVGVGFICAMCYGFTCGLFNIFFLNSSTGLTLIENLFGWVIGIGAGVMYRKEDDFTVPFLTNFSSLIGLIVGWLHGIATIILNWGNMGTLSSYAHELAEQSSGLTGLIYEYIGAWSSAFAQLSSGGDISISLSMLLISLLPHVIAASIAAALIPCGVSYICDYVSGNHDLSPN